MITTHSHKFRIGNHIKVSDYNYSRKYYTSNHLYKIVSLRFLWSEQPLRHYLNTLRYASPLHLGGNQVAKPQLMESNGMVRQVIDLERFYGQ